MADEKIFFHVQRTDNSLELWIGKEVKENKKCAYYQGEMVIVRRSFEENQKIIYDLTTNAISVNNCVPSEIFSSEEVARSDYGPAIKFLYEVIGSLNEYLNLALTNNSFLYSQTKSISVQFDNNSLLGLLRNITNLSGVEKMAKISGLKAVISSLRDREFVLQDAKKLRAIVGLPAVVLSWIKTQRLDNCVKTLTNLANGDDTIAIKLMEYLKTVKTRIHSYSGYDCSRFLNDVLSFHTASNIPVLRILNYLVAQNIYFSKKMGLPTIEIAELNDYYEMVTKKNIVFKLPNNLVKQHAVLSYNVAILNFPRAQEFKAAVKKYEALEFSNDNYMIKVPSSERELFDEGLALNHCVASYRDSIIDDGTIVVFLRKKDNKSSPFITIEVDKHFDLLQIKQNFDEDVVDPEIFAFIGKWKQARGYLISGGKTLGKTA